MKKSIFSFINYEKSTFTDPIHSDVSLSTFERILNIFLKSSFKDLHRSLLCSIQTRHDDAPAGHQCQIGGAFISKVITAVYAKPARFIRVQPSINTNR